MINDHYDTDNMTESEFYNMDTYYFNESHKIHEKNQTTMFGNKAK